MVPQISEHRSEIADLCRRLQVRRLEVFGSAEREADFVAVARRASRDVEYRGRGQRQHGGASAQKNELKPHLKEQWVIPPEANSAFVAAIWRTCWRSTLAPTILSSQIVSAITSIPPFMTHPHP